MTTPNKWVLLKLNEGYKVFGTWSGGYLSGDSWRLNSGIKKITRNSDLITFHGYSGSKYVCHMSMYGIAGASNHAVLKSIVLTQGAEVLSELDAELYIKQQMEEEE